MPLRDARDIEEERHIRDAIRRTQRRTIMWSAVIAGIVTLFITRVTEQQQFNSQSDRSRQNCEFLNDRLKVSAARLDRDATDLDTGADNVLGNAHKKPPLRPFKFKGTAFEPFQKIILANALQSRLKAKQDREDATATRAGIKDCAQVFPHRSVFLGIG